MVARLLHGFHAQDMVSDLGQLLFFRVIFDFIHHETEQFGIGVLGRMTAWVGSVALALLTLWILWHGYRIVTGQNRQPAMVLVTDAVRACAVVTVAMGFSLGGIPVFQWLGDGLLKAICALITADATPVADRIDRNLAVMQLALASVDGLDVAGSPSLHADRNRAQWLIGAGIGGPAVVGGALLITYQVALALFVGFGPLFVLCLLFPQTRPLFSRWLEYGVGTMFAYAMLSVMIVLATKVVGAVALAFWVNRLAGNGPEGISSLAMQQGGLGLVMTTLIVATPPMAAAFFRGLLGNFIAYSMFGGGGANGTVQTPRPSSAAQPDVNRAPLHGAPGVTPVPDEIKQLPPADGDSFLQRHPHALASNDWAGRSSPLPYDVHPIAIGNLPPPVDSTLAGLRGNDETQRVVQDRAFVDALLRSNERNSADVLVAQQIVREAGYSLMTRSFERNPSHPDGVTGSWGEETEGAVRTFLRQTPENILRRKDAVVQIASHLEIPANPRTAATSTYLEQDGRRYNFVFAANSYANALDFGYSVRDAVMNVDVGAYLAAADAAGRISDLGADVDFGVSSGWRPNVGSGAHPNGVGLDFTSLQMTQNGQAVSTTFVDPGKRVGHAPSIPEPDLASQYRESLYAIREEAGIRQIFTPWQMLGSPDGQFRVNHPSRINDNDWIHRHHVHIGMRAY